VSRFVGDGRVWDQTAAASWLSRAQAHLDGQGFGSLAVVEAATGRTIGEAGLILLEGGPQVELTYALAHDAWGAGFATEAARAVVAWGFGSVGLQRIVASFIRRTPPRCGSSRSSACGLAAWPCTMAPSFSPSSWRRPGDDAPAAPRREGSPASAAILEP
jgi:hypothetical protein